MPKILEKTEPNAVCITNGFDESDSANNPTIKKISTETQFTLSYIGVLEQLRNPENLWKALNDLVKTNSDFAEKFKLKFVGRIDDKILQSIENSSLKKHIENLGYLSHDKAIDEMSNSSMLLLLIFQIHLLKELFPVKYLNI